MSERHGQSAGEGGAVVLTGSSSGIGAACARLLASSGYTVFAGRRDIAQTGKPEPVGRGVILPLPLDVTDDASVEDAYGEVDGRVGRGGRLAGLVNNAGGVVIGPVELLSMEDLRDQFEVNVVGAARVARAFLPALRRSQGRIVNMGSLTGRMSFPFAGPYSSSKAALAAMSHAMRRELRPHGVHVTFLEPGNIRTGIWDKHVSSVEALLDRTDPERRNVYEQDLRADLRMVRKLQRGGGDPELVARAVLRALRSEKPRARYAVGLDAKAMTALLRIVPSTLSDRVIERLMGLAPPSSRRS